MSRPWRWRNLPPGRRRYELPRLIGECEITGKRPETGFVYETMATMAALPVSCFVGNHAGEDYRGVSRR